MERWLKVNGRCEKMIKSKIKTISKIREMVKVHKEDKKEKDFREIRGGLSHQLLADNRYELIIVKAQYNRIRDRK